MKKVWALITALALMLALTVGASAAVPKKPSEFAYAYDYDGSVLSGSTLDTIAQYGAALEDATGIQAVAVVVDFLDGQDPADYATDLINTWGIGQKGENNGVVVLLARGDRKIQIGTGKGLDRVLSGSKCGDLIDDNIDYFADNKFDKGMLNLYEDVCRYLARAKGKTLSLSQGASGSGYGSGYDSAYGGSGSYGGYDEGGFDLFEFILGVIFVYIVICVLFNALVPNRGGCLSYFFMGWLFGRGNRRRPPRGPRPPLGGGGFGPRPPRPPRPPPPARRAEAPSRVMSLAMATEATTGITLIPASFHWAMNLVGLPAPVVTTATFSSATTWATSSTKGLMSMIFTPKGRWVRDLAMRICSRT